MKIRQAQRSDYASLARFARQTFLAAYGGENPPQRVLQHADESFAEAIIERDLASNDVTFLIATTNDDRDGNGIAGYVKLCWQRPIAELDDRESAQLERIYVDQRRHSRGLGSALIKAAAETALAHGAVWLWLGVWQENQRAQTFYERHGFERVGVTHFMMGDVREEDYIYALQLGPDG